MFIERVGSSIDLGVDEIEDAGSPKFNQKSIAFNTKSVAR
jgi:hypothetical protein